MLKSKIAPIIVGIILIILAVSWFMMINSIDYSQMKARSSTPKAVLNATAEPAQTPAP
ncbi:hypothetical protein LJC15_02720 [Desulfovibrio sp. OttesenSCG-928-G11]|nr:hypothetical protein [Desulfovibrio sp. OttesenSCG-928-G11]